MAPPDLDWLRSFVAFAEHRNFTRAARAVGRSQPALHAQVQRLAEHFGVPLYRRQGRELVLTEAGQTVLAYGRDMLAQTDALVAALQGRTPERPLVLAAGEGSFLYLLGPKVRDYPGALRLLVRDGPATVEAVRGGEADVGVCALDRPPRDLESQRFARVGMAVALPAQHPLAAKIRIEVADLAGERLVVPPAGRPLRLELERALAGIPWTPAVEASGWPLILHFVALGCGLAVVNAVCTPPAGVVLRDFPILPPRLFMVLRRRGAALPLWSWLTGQVSEAVLTSGHQGMACADCATG